MPLTRTPAGTPYSVPIPEFFHAENAAYGALLAAQWRADPVKAGWAAEAPFWIESLDALGRVFIDEYMHAIADRQVQLGNSMGGKRDIGRVYKACYEAISSLPHDEWMAYADGIAASMGSKLQRWLRAGSPEPFLPD